MRILKNDNGAETVVNEYPADKFNALNGVTVKDGYLSLFATFDIETSNLTLDGTTRAFMYIWQICLGNIEGGDEVVYVGRTWNAFIDFIEEVAHTYKLTEKRKMVVYIHNAGFEFQFLRSVLVISDMFATKKRVPISFVGNDVFEFRCSWRLTNMSLGKFCESEKVEHGKQTGYDYLKLRYADTELSDSELLYAIDDVLGLHEALRHSLKMSGDTLATVPKTSTGYVRREARDKVRENPKNIYTFKDSALDPYEYKLCKAAARGGNTHANVLYAGDILGTDSPDAKTFIRSRDKKSSYPFEMVVSLYPMGKFLHDRSNVTLETLPEVAHNDGTAVIMHIVLYNVKLKPNVYFPYIAKNKCQSLPPKAGGAYRYDNGRVIEAPYLRMVCTEIDAAIIDKQYFYDKVEVVDAIRADKALLCKEYRDYVLELFRVKCELEGQDEYFYMKFKNKINALFGMMLTDVSREDITYLNGKWGNNLPPVATSLFKYYKSYNSFLSYQHGIYVTANARLSLQEGLDAVGIDGVYTDTDSVKYMGDYDEKFNALNAAIIEKSKRVGVEPVTVRGKTSTLGIWESDAAYSAFITHGAKKYAYRYSEDPSNKPSKWGKIGVTVAGLNKNKAADYLNHNGGLKAFDAGAYSVDGYRTGLEFGTLDSGRLEAKYDDVVRRETIVHDGHTVELTSNVALVPTTYTLGITKEYSDLIEMRETVFR